jgi:TPR repeat protein
MTTVLLGASTTQASQSSIQDLIKTAESGDQEGQFRLGHAYEDGSGIEQNDELAVRWYRKAAEQGHSKAQNSLGFMYRQGKGVLRNKVEAAQWYRKAAQQCDPNGAYNLAIAYYNGDGLDADPGLAFAWLLVAKQCGNLGTKSALDQITSELRNQQREIAETKFIEYMIATPDFKPDVDKMLTTMGTIDPPLAGDICRAYAAKGMKWRDTTKAQSWCEKAIALEMEEVYIVLGTLAEERNDFSKAAELYRKAAEAGDSSAVGSLGILYLEGKGVRQDPAEAYFWLYLATNTYRQVNFKSGFDLAAQQLPDKEKKEQEKRAKNWAEE